MLLVSRDLKVNKRKRKSWKKTWMRWQFLSVPPPERRRFSYKQNVSAKHKSAETGRRLHLRWLPVFICSVPSAAWSVTSRRNSYFFHSCCTWFLTVSKRVHHHFLVLFFLSVKFADLYCIFTSALQTCFLH